MSFIGMIRVRDAGGHGREGVVIHAVYEVHGTAGDICLDGQIADGTTDENGFFSWTYTGCPLQGTGGIAFDTDASTLMVLPALAKTFRTLGAGSEPEYNTTATVEIRLPA